MGRETVAVTRGAIETFTPDELKGVIAHELGHIANGDTKALLLTVVGNGIFTIIIFLLKIVMFIFDLINLIITRNTIIAILIFAIRFVFDIVILAISYIGILILSINSRSNEYNADEFAYKIGYGGELVEALYLLQKISLPANLSLLEKLKASHPHIADRIGRLEEKLEAEQEE